MSKSGAPSCNQTLQKLAAFSFPGTFYRFVQISPKRAVKYLYPGLIKIFYQAEWKGCCRAPLNTSINSSSYSINCNCDYITYNIRPIRFNFCASLLFSSNSFSTVSILYRTSLYWFLFNTSIVLIIRSFLLCKNFLNYCIYAHSRAHMNCHL